MPRATTVNIIRTIAGRFNCVVVVSNVCLFFQCHGLVCGVCHFLVMLVFIHIKWILVGGKGRKCNEGGLIVKYRSDHQRVTLNFSSNVGLGPVSIVYQKISGMSSTPKKYFKF